MKVTYNKLWKLMIDQHLIRKDLKERADISAGTMAKLSRNECVNLSIIVRICEVLNCDIGDVVEIVEE